MISLPCLQDQAETIAVVHHGRQNGDVDRKDDARAEASIPGTASDGDFLIPVHQLYVMSTDGQIVDISSDVQHNAGLVDELDLALSFAQTAVDSNYVRPKLNSS